MIIQDITRLIVWLVFLLMTRKKHKTEKTVGVPAVFYYIKKFLEFLIVVLF